jgi:hypothetical protein
LWLRVLPISFALSLADWFRVLVIIATLSFIYPFAVLLTPLPLVCQLPFSLVTRCFIWLCIWGFWDIRILTQSSASGFR